MSLWQEHVKRLEREADLRRMNRWLEAHPWQANLWAIGLAIAVLELAGLLKFALDALARWIGGAP
jgi:hypothetical protein